MNRKVFPVRSPKYWCFNSGSRAKSQQMLLGLASWLGLQDDVHATIQGT